jgi:hypothetical protein
MSLPPLRPPSSPMLLWLAASAFILMACHALWPMAEPVHFRTAPFVSGHGAAAAAAFIVALTPPLA